jgi:zinc and cadmium transporter
MSATVIIAILVFLATLAGGFFALKFKDKLHLIVGFSAGAVLGIAFLDLFPEAVKLIGDAGLAAKIALGGAILYMVVDRFFFNHSHGHHHDHEHEDDHHREHKGRGIVRAASLVLHSFLDGLAIGFSFQVSATTGTVVAIAVLAHDFSDGINTVAAILKGGDNKRAKWWLVADAIAPVVGIIAGAIIVVNEAALGAILSVFAGFFVYIALADMIPESFHAHPKKWTTIMTVLGAAFIMFILQFAHF